MMETVKQDILYHSIPESDNISQGDILFNFPLILPNKESMESIEQLTAENLTNIRLDRVQADLIIMSQACDMVDDPQRSRKPLDSVICAAIFDIGNFKLQTVQDTNAGRKPTYYLLNRDGLYLDKSYLIDFSNIYTVPYSLLNEFTTNYGNRILPISPILEKISQHFGNYFSRIGTEYERNKADLKTEYEQLRK